MNIPTRNYFRPTHTVVAKHDIFKKKNQFIRFRVQNDFVHRSMLYIFSMKFKRNKITNEKYFTFSKGCVFVKFRKNTANVPFAPFNSDATALATIWATIA